MTSAVKKRLSLAQRLSLRIAARANRLDRVVLSQKNIFIFPSKAGFGFLFLLALMLLTAINYQSSLVYMMVFLLGSVFFISIWLCFLNLQGLQVEIDETIGCEPEEGGEFGVRLYHPRHHLYGLSLAVQKGYELDLKLEAGQAQRVRLSSNVRQRGRYIISRLAIQTYYPFGLIRGWSWIKLNSECLVYPKAEEPPEEVYEAEGGSSEGQQVKGGDKDVLRGFRAGDNLSRVHWKKYASSDVMVVRDESLVAPESQQLSWWDYPSASDEQRLSYLRHRIEESEAGGHDYALILPAKELPLSRGRRHRAACLEALAQHGFGRAVEVSWWQEIAS